MRGLALLLALLPALSAPALARDPGVLQLAPGHGRPDAFVLTGRLIEDEGVGRADPGASRKRNFLRAMRALKSEEIAGATVEVRIGGHRFSTITDREGRFLLRAEGIEPPLAVGDQPATVSVLNDRGHPTPPTTVPVQILADVPAVAILSDVDDTLMISQVVDKRRLLKNALLKNAAQVPAVPGAGPAFRAAREAGAAAFFYLSGSPQNFLPRTLQFLERESLPAGPVMLKDFGTDPLFAQDGYKTAHIRAILALHPRLKLVLVGDSGETDPEIYLRLRGQLPDRIAGIVIRRVPERTDPAARFTGLITIDDFAQDPELLARLVKSAGAR